MQSRLRIVAGLAVVLAVGACGTFTRAPRQENDVITREQMLSGNFHSAYEVVEALHSNWLTSKPLTLGVNGPPPVVLVYYDAIRLGGVEELRGIQLAGVASIEHFDGPAATARWGVGHANGVILVSSHPIPRVSSETARSAIR